ncbi:hypothetical protein FUAX_03700 [Fulvitalea axinellae]|uniref:DUF4271 domain-containing protein n=1 Tax=Fulvitalea axinellae TaxID=1182444 RepID=A0AAU9CIX8_9BACT|nr:hypothetical protein FUAX_03700 [Fulvitalea axinellae]
MRLKSLLMCLTALFFLSFGHGLKAEDLRREGFVYNQATGSFVPYVGGKSLSDVKEMGFFVNAERDSLKMFLPKGSSLFVNNKLAAISKEGHLSVAVSLLLSYSESEDEAFVVLYNPAGLNGARFQNETKRQADSHEEQRDGSDYRDFLVMGSMLVFVLMAVLRLYYGGRPLYLPLNLRGSGPVVAGGKRRSGFSAGDVALWSGYGLAVGFVVANLKLLSSEVPITQISLRDALWVWGVWGMAFTFLLGTKRLYLSYMASVFALNGVDFIHFRDFVSYRLYGAMVALFAVLLLFFAQGYVSFSLYEIVFEILLMFYFVFFIVFYLFSFRSFPFNKFHLFSYLCISETLPFLAGLKILLSH